MPLPVDAVVRAELAPTGVLRVALNYANFLLVSQREPGAAGVAPDLGRELARRIGVDAHFVGYENAGLVADAAALDAWDVAFIGADPAREGEVTFSSAYVEIDATYLVPAGSPLRRVEDVDAPGVRIAVAARSAYDLFLERHLQHAELVRADGLAGSCDVFVRERLDALAGLRARLMTDVASLQGARVLDGRFMAVRQAIGTPAPRREAAGYVARFARDITASGLVATLVTRHGIEGLTVRS